MSWCTNWSGFMILLPLGVPVQHRNRLHALTSIFTPCTARNMQLRSPAGAEKCRTFAAGVTSATQEPSKGYLLSHTQLSVSNVNFNWGVCEGQEEDDAGRDCGQALDRDGTRGTEIHATNSEKGPTPCWS